MAELPTAVRLRVAGRSTFTAYLNGSAVAQGKGGRSPETVWVTRRLTRGRNVLAFECEGNVRSPGLAYELMLRQPDGRTVWLVSGALALTSRRFAQDWQEPSYDDRRWMRAKLLGNADLGEVGAGTAPPTTGPAVPPAGARTTTPAAAPPVDSTRLVRVWDIGAGGRPGRNPYTAAREPGQRMLLSCETPSAELMPTVAAAGFTLLQTDSDHLGTEEVSPGVWDFRGPEGAQRRARAAGFDWCYFPHYAFPPKWYANQVPFTRIRCLEHDRPIPAFSPWDPRFTRSLGRGYKEIAARFRSSAAGLYLGVHGDYGEAGLFMGARTAVPGQREEWQARFGNLHDHLGWWCADTLARAAFRDAMLRRYGALDVLNAAWGTRYAAAKEVAYPSGPSAGRRWWLDFVGWYMGSVGSITDSVCRVARRELPDALLMLPVGFGDENPRGGNDNSLLPRIAARSRVDVRSTHGGYQPFARGQASMLNRIASACRFYGVPFWSEPPGRITPEQQVSRIFEAASLGSKGYYDWSGNIREGREVYSRFGKFLRTERPVVDVAMFYPSTSHLLHPDVGFPQVFASGCAAVRDLFAYDIVDERMIVDGALDRYRVLALWEGTVVEADALAKIRAWVRAGGVVVAYDFGKMETVEGDRSWFTDLFGYAGRLRRAPALFRYIGEGGTPARSRIRVGLPQAGSFTLGDWFEPDPVKPGAAPADPLRWTGANADVLVPVRGDRSATLLVRAAFPPETARRKREVLVNGVHVGVLDTPAETTYQFEVPANLLAGREVAAVTIRSETWVPADALKNSSDRRALGTYVAWVEMSPAGAPAAADVPMPAGRIEAVTDIGRMRSEWARPYGQGWTVYYPGRRAQLPGYYEVLRYLVYHLSDLDPTKQDALNVDDSWDGVYATLFTDKVLYYNPTASSVTRTIVLAPGFFAGRRDMKPPTAFNQTITIEANSIAALYFGSAPQELLLQCEKFTELGGLRPQEGAGFHPGTGPTHVLVPVGKQIATRFECAVAGRYRVFYRAVRRGVQARAEVLVDGRPLESRQADAAGPSRPDTSVAGTLYLARGIHTLVVRPRKGEDVRADYVLLSDDLTIAGYRFALK